MFALFGRFLGFLSRARATARASSSRAARGRSARGRGLIRGGAAAEALEELIEEAIELAEEAEEIIMNAYYEALTRMASMVGNPGQASVFEDYVVPAFEEAFTESDPENGWEDVDIGEYMVFMGEIVGEGNDIMSDAYDDAASLLEDAEDILG